MSWRITLHTCGPEASAPATRPPGHREADRSGWCGWPLKIPGTVRACLPLLIALAVRDAFGQTPPAAPSADQSLSDVVVSATRSEQRSFDAPASVQAVGAAVIRDAGPQINLSEALNRIPGVMVLNRQNYAQDLQLSIRGFGARSQFGIRGVRLIVDGIPATIPDGQGQGATVSLPSAARIEVLRGPLSQLYGNSAGGVVQVFSAKGTSPAIFESDLLYGSNSTRRASVRTAGESGQHNWMIDYSDFSTGGWRDHSAATRKQLNAKWVWTLGDNTTLNLIANSFDQGLSQDALGLTRAEFNTSPRQTNGLATTFDTGKTVHQDQLGAVLDHRLDSNRKLSARIYYGQRDVFSKLALPLSAQAAAGSAGGIVSLSREYSGVGLQYQHRLVTGTDSALTATLGYDGDRMRELRQGFINSNGAQGNLKRNELDRVSSDDYYAQLNWALGPRWSVIAGVRTTRVAFSVSDRFIAPGNPDDSGAVSYSGTNPVLGLTYHLNEQANLYLNWGRGIETPTFTELAYRSGGSGPNLGLLAARSRHLEAGIKIRLARRHALDVAVFSITNNNELGVDTNIGGRSTFKNVGSTRREGIELAYTGQLSETLSAYASLSTLNARFLDSFVSNGSGVAAGNKLPGTPNRAAFAELVWRPRLSGPWSGFSTAVEAVHRGKLYVNDLNSDTADQVTTFNLRASLQQKFGTWRFRELIRIDNLSNRIYAGSVIVNEGNGRYFETAPGRTWMISVTASTSFN